MHIAAERWKHWQSSVSMARSGKSLKKDRICNLNLDIAARGDIEHRLA